ncbi:MAG: helix-turn-helix transcriptional regulator [Ruminiclostridium sp.]|jgi:transcriptional regulator with XRE-family HTH domain|nr:helix-turn-helix transcriptional regulator [Ruminiclostridium sp.]
MARIIDGEAKNIVGDQVRAIRVSKRMSQQELADQLELLAIYVCRGSISRLEDKQRTVTDMELYGIAKVLDVPITKLFPQNAEEESS